MSTAPDLAPAITRGEFYALPLAERWRALAADILLLLDVGKLTPLHGCYVLDRFPEGSLDEVLKTNPDCYVCARGALVVAHSRIVDDLAARGLSNSYDLSSLASADFSSPVLTDLFDSDDPEATQDWRDVEAAFEGWEDDGEAWAIRYRSATARLRAICRNILTHGRFDINDL